LEKYTHGKGAEIQSDSVTGDLSMSVLVRQLTNTKISATCTKIELVYAGVTERTRANPVIIYFKDIFTKNPTMIVNFLWYFFYAQYLSHFITISHHDLYIFSICHLQKNITLKIGADCIAFR